VTVYCLCRPRLGPTASKVAVVGIVYLILSSIDGLMRASVVSRVIVNVVIISADQDFQPEFNQNTVQVAGLLRCFDTVGWATGRASGL